jgi:HSP20 family protein
MNTVENNPAVQTNGHSAGAQTGNYISPDVNIYEDGEGYVLEAEMPGVNKDTLDITLEDNELVITGRRAPVEKESEAIYRESRGWDYRRVFELDPAIDSAKVTAKIDEGVLVLHLPKSERVKPRKVVVNS